MVDGYGEIYCFDRNKESAACINIRGNIQSKLIANHELPYNIMGIFVELNLLRV